jgi:PilZ domain
MQPLKRRSSRVALNASITLSGHDRAKCVFTMPARATSLNRHGGAIQLNRELLLGSTIVLRNNHNTQAPARVVANVRTRESVYTYGVEFLEADAVKNFWGINFPSTAVIYSTKLGSSSYKLKPGMM